MREVRPTFRETSGERPIGPVDVDRVDARLPRSYAEKHTNDSSDTNRKPNVSTPLRRTESDSTIALFSGAGGLSIGFARAGLAPTLAVDNDPDACATYSSNLNAESLCADVSSETAIKRVQQTFSRARPFAMIGGPPCQGFSTAGARNADDPRNRLIFAYLDTVERLRPLWIVFENVEGFLTSNGGESIRDFIRLLVDLGYTVNLEKINFAGYGVPQARKRVVIVANCIGIPYVFPAAEFSFEGKKHRSAFGAHPGTTVANALLGLGGVQESVEALAPYAQSVPLSPYDRAMRLRNAEPGTRQHVSPAMSSADFERARSLKPGQSLRNLPEHLWPESFRSRAFRRVRDGMPTARRGGAPAGLKRLDPDCASLTITSMSSREFIHPFEDRPVSLRECARLQSFPDRFVFEGGSASISRQIGNAFPPMAAELLAASILEQHADGGSSPPGLLAFRLTDSLGFSPALRTTEHLLNQLARRPTPRQLFLMPKEQRERAGITLTAHQRSLITRSRQAKSITLSDRELVRLLSVMLRDIGRGDLTPEWIAHAEPYRGYYHTPLAWFYQDEQRPVDLSKFFAEVAASVDDFETLFQCICELHKRRRKYAAILQRQGKPTMDQVARRGLLEYGMVASPALTSWLVWRKWMFDIDNRAAQETGYLFEPILARALGGVPVTARNSPIKRIGAPGARQIDCLVDVDERLAYEFKVRLTIASSGQGRFAQELAFPEEAAAAGYVPVLIVLDPTENAKLTQLSDRFRMHGGRVYIGADAWAHIEERAGATMARFVERYVREPIASITADFHDARLDDLHGTWDDATGRIALRLGTHEWHIEHSNDAPIEEDEEDA
jgi:DNA (cytosine-5)-methyltransferase 1